MAQTEQASSSGARGRTPAEAGRIERQLAAAQEISHLGSWEWDLASNAVTWSDELYRIYGLEPRSCEITFQSFLSRLHPDDRDRVRGEVETALARGGRFNYDERIVRPDGTIRNVRTVGEVLRDDTGKALGLLGTCRDVTDELRRDETIRLYADMVQNVQIALTVWEVGNPDDPSTFRLVAFNPAAERAARMHLASRVGRSFPEILPYAQGGELQRLLTGVARDGRVREAEVLRSRDTRDPTRALHMKGFPLPGKRVGVAVEDITGITRARRFREGEQRVLEMIAQGKPLAETLTELILAIEEHSPSTHGSILLLDEDGVHIRSCAAPHLPEGYSRAIDGAPIGPTAGSCGTAAYTGKAIFARDIATDPFWVDYRDLAAAHGLRACWSTPIFANDGHVLGTFAMYYFEPRVPSPEDRALIARASQIAGIAIERRQLEDQLRALSAYVEDVREEERTGIAREIHDVLGQALTALKMDLAWTERRIGPRSTASESTLREKLKAMAASTDEILRVVRRISAELRPGVLDDLGLTAAIEWQAGEFERRTGSTCTVVSHLEDKPLEEAVATALFRILQEALTNVARHAGAGRVDVLLEEVDGMIRLEIVDDGVGIPTRLAANPTSLGLLGMRERARRLGGDVVVTRIAPRGTRVLVTMPAPRVALAVGT